MSERMFPIMDGPAIPWSLIAPHEAQAWKNHYQTLQRLSERGGLSACEALAVMESKGWDRDESPTTDKPTALKRLKEIVDTDARLELTRLRAENERLRGEADEIADSAIRSVLLIRCAKHYSMPQLNSNEVTGAECGACVAEDLDRVKTDLVRENALRVAFGAQLDSIAETVSASGNIDEAVVKLKAERDTLKELLREAVGQMRFADDAMGGYAPLYEFLARPEIAALTKEASVDHHSDPLQTDIKDASNPNL